MKVAVKFNGKQIQMDMSEALSPDPYTNHCATIGDIANLKAEYANNAIGKLLTNLVERGLLSLEAADEISGNNHVVCEIKV